RPVAVPAADVSLISETEMMNMNSFLSINPFRISPMPFQNDEDAYTPEGEGEVPITGDLATAVLKWPMTDVGVWIESQGKLHLVLIDESFDVYTLEKVSYRQAFFSRGDERVVKDLLFAAPVPGKTVASLPADRSSAPAAMGGQVSAAEAGGKEGTISSELVLRLMENPFDELKNVRLRPKDGEQGLQIQWINKDSILSQLGVRKGDLIRSINGIPFRNMADITNSMNSLMSSERFDVEVVRDGAPTSLKYVVR
ncbi:MAG: hypothetical protein LBQ90_10740, partial [Synergistaceae bacterium]|nr:hypothetical protein [Synergistaceae bacterium]